MCWEAHAVAGTIAVLARLETIGCVGGRKRPLPIDAVNPGSRVVRPGAKP